ncbi:SDR family oxidoreductase [Mucilaginibacter sp. McL0603]|uniref:SDR family oxidoreductase n=1 Tax=Mucilaginibacter sp. McL0603 TaxID=3415670 RepID=UPI003CF76AD2
MMKNWNLENKKALVTGGSKGIGKAVVKELTSLGAEVLFTGRNENDLQSALDSIINTGLTGHILAGSVSDLNHRMAINDWITSHWGRLDILVNNAGINFRKASDEYTVDEYLRVIDTDLLAPFEFCRVLLPLLRKSDSPAIINISSVAGSYDLQTGAPYGMAKAGLIQLTRNLAAEWGGYGIRVNTVSPWFTETPLTKGYLSQADKLEKIKSRTPFNRVAQDDEIAAAVAFLAMDKASYITGQNLSVDGGVTTGLL